MKGGTESFYMVSFLEAATMRKSGGTLKTNKFYLAQALAEYSPLYQMDGLLPQWMRYYRHACVGEIIEIRVYQNARSNHHLNTVVVI